MANMAACPKCGQAVPVTRDGRLSRHVRGAGAGRHARCSGSGKRAT